MLKSERSIRSKLSLDLSESDRIIWYVIFASKERFKKLFAYSWLFYLS